MYFRRGVLGAGRIKKGEPGMKAKGRRISGSDEESGLRESQAPYSNDFEANNGLLSTKNACFWKSNL